VTPAKVAIALGERGYEILIGARLLAQGGALMLPVLRRRRVLVVTDATVAELHMPSFIRSLDAHGIAHAEFVLPPGETTKTFEHLAALIDRVQAAGVSRDDCMVALGGGVIGDLAGFAASIILRGIDYIQIPTTLLAQVDSSVGGKTGINTRFGKNLVGSFHQPRLVLADTGTLDTLSERELRAGYAETVKYGLIGDAPFFTWLERHGQDVLAGDAEARRHAVATCCAAKARYVAADERESGERALLNFGHTFAHALEVETGYESLLHGEAVAIGMVLAFGLSARLGLCPRADVDRVRRHLAASGLPVSPAEVPGGAPNAEALADHMRRDKKVRDGRITFVLARGLGDAFLHRSVPPDVVLEVLRDAVAEQP